MMLPVMNRTSLLYTLASFFIFLAGDKSFGQATSAPLATIRLYEKLSGTDRVPVVTCLDLEKGGQLLAVGGDDQVVRLWDVDRKEFVLELHDRLDWVRDIAFSPDKTRLATVGQDGKVKIWNTATGTLVRTVGDAARGAQKIIFHPDGSRLAVCGFDVNVSIYDAIGGSLVDMLAAPGTGSRTIAYSPDGVYLAVAGRTGTVRVWKTSDTRNPVDLKGDQRRVNALAFNSDGSVLAVAGESPYIMLWNPRSGQLIESLPERPGKTFALAFCGDTLLASGESDNAIRLWDLSTKQQTTTFMGHTGTISTMVFQASSGQLISGSFDTSIKFWAVGKKQ